MSIDSTPAPKRTVPLARPSFGAREEELLLETVRSGWVTQGPRVAELEQGFAARAGAAEAVAVSNCTTGLFLTMHALGIGPGDEVIVPSLSFIATGNSVVHCGATPVFADIDPATYNLAPDAVRAAIGPKTRAIMVAHQLGLPADLVALRAIAAERGVPLIEDAACAIGSTWRGQPVGRGADVAVFSLHPRKVVVAGEGGVITTDDAELAARLRVLRHQGMSVSDLVRHRADGVVFPEYPVIGFNFRMSDVQAALAVAQLERLDDFLAERRALARVYDAAIARIGGESELDGLVGLVGPHSAPELGPNYQSYIVRAVGVSGAWRDALLGELRARGVGSSRGVMASHLEACYARPGSPGRAGGPLIETERAADETFLLPLYNGLDADDQAYVIEALKEALGDALAAMKTER